MHHDDTDLGELLPEQLRFLTLVNIVLSIAAGIFLGFDAIKSSPLATAFTKLNPFSARDAPSDPKAAPNTDASAAKANQGGKHASTIGIVGLWVIGLLLGFLSLMFSSPMVNMLLAVLGMMVSGAAIGMDLKDNDLDLKDNRHKFSLSKTAVYGLAATFAIGTSVLSFMTSLQEIRNNINVQLGCWDQ